MLGVLSLCGKRPRDLAGTPWERSLTFCSKSEPEYLVTVSYRFLPKVSAQNFTLQDRKS